MASTNPERQTLHIKNMVGNSCIKLVKDILSAMEHVRVIKVDLGLADIEVPAGEINLYKISKLFNECGFSIITDKETQTVEQIKTAVLQLIYYGNNMNSLIRNSDYLSDKLGIPYLQLSKLFSEKEKINLEKYIILVKIERVKELLAYNEMTLSEIAYMMGYSSVQYLSNQFKQVAGLSVSEYKNLPEKPRKALGEILNKL
jgi:AraC family transcriptional regulator